MLAPQVIVCSVGTEIFELSGGLQHEREGADGSMLLTRTEHEVVQEDDGHLGLCYTPNKRWLQFLDENEGGWSRDFVVGIAKQRVPELRLQVGRSLCLTQQLGRQ